MASSEGEIMGGKCELRNSQEEMVKWCSAEAACERHVGCSECAQPHRGFWELNLCSEAAHCDSKRDLQHQHPGNSKELHNKGMLSFQKSYGMEFFEACRKRWRIICTTQKISTKRKKGTLKPRPSASSLRWALSGMLGTTFSKNSTTKRPRMA